MPEDGRRSLAQGKLHMLVTSIGKTKNHAVNQLFVPCVFLQSLCIVIYYVGHSGWSPFYVLDIVRCMSTQKHGSIL